MLTYIVLGIVFGALIGVMLLGASGQCAGCFIAGMTIVCLCAAALVILLILYCYYQCTLTHLDTIEDYE